MSGFVYFIIIGFTLSIKTFSAIDKEISEFKILNIFYCINYLT